MEKSIIIGTDNFEEFIRNNGYYVDKTELLYELAADAPNEVTLFTRPRRFGKTLMMSMMESFFSIQKGDSRELFDGLSIMKHEAFCREWMNQYPVLFWTLKGVEALSFEQAYEKLQVKLAGLCKTHEKLVESDRIDSDDRRIFLELKAQKASCANVTQSLKTIMRMMTAVYGKPVILLIDEYDVPLAMASEHDTPENGYYLKMLDVIRGMFEAALYENAFLKFAVFTGCLRLSKESLFPEKTKIISCSVLDKRFSGYFGFTQEEVDSMLAVADRQEKAEAVCARYKGYMFGNTSVYCPWDVTNYVADLLRNKDAEPKNYWKNTSHNGILLTFAERTDFDVSDKFETLLNGGTIQQKITDALTYDLLDASEDNLWSVLLMTGYLTKADPASDGNPVELKIPNSEIAGIFEETVVQRFHDALARDRSRQLELMDALWNGDEEKASKLTTDILP